MAGVAQIPLGEGVTIPQMGVGVFQVPVEGTERVVADALRLGYRHVDTAAAYGNEEPVGAAIRRSGLDRDDIFVTTKLWNDDQGYDSTLRAFDASMGKLQLDVLDLYLIHWPAPRLNAVADTWRAFEEIKASGRTRAIGVSNFGVSDLEALAGSGAETPAVNQIECHPYLVQDELRAYHAEHGIVTEAWSPIAQGAVLSDPVIEQIASDRGVTAAQVVLAWHLALGNVVFPKSTKSARLQENLASVDLELTDDEVAAISALDRGERTGPDPSEFYV